MAYKMLKKILKNKYLIITLLSFLLGAWFLIPTTYADQSRTCDDGTIAQAELGQSCQGSPSTATNGTSGSGSGSSTDPATGNNDPAISVSDNCGYETNSNGEVQYYKDGKPATPNDAEHGSPKLKPCGGTATVNECGSNHTSPCKADTKDVCGKGSKQTEVKFNFGCLGQNYPSSNQDVSPTEDLIFAIIRFLSNGVGVVVVISVIIAGIRYSAAQSNPQATAGAIGQIRNSIIGLIIYIFMFALVQFLVPGGIFN